MNRIFFIVIMFEQFALALRTDNGTIYQTTLSKHFLYLASHIDVLLQQRATLRACLERFVFLPTPMAYPVDCGLIFIDIPAKTTFNLQSYRNPWTFWLGVSESTHIRQMIEGLEVFRRYAFDSTNFSYAYVLLRALLTQSLHFGTHGQHGAVPQFDHKDSFIAFLYQYQQRSEYGQVFEFAPTDWKRHTLMYQSHLFAQYLEQFFSYSGTSTSHRPNFDAIHNAYHQPLAYWEIFLRKTYAHTHLELFEHAQHLFERYQIQSNVPAICIAPAVHPSWDRVLAL